jgi:hypothetical protein
MIIGKQGDWRDRSSEKSLIADRAHRNALMRSLETSPSELVCDSPQQIRTHLLTKGLLRHRANSQNPSPSTAVVM